MKNKEIKHSIRPWGEYFILDSQNEYKIKRIEVNPKARLSYQYHNYRSETWIVIKGKGVITIEGNSKKIKKGDIVQIPKTLKHRVENNGENKLVFIEIQTGTYFGEDDIVRIQDDYNRIK